jgi:hypothetical protein
VESEKLRDWLLWLVIIALVGLVTWLLIDLLVF